MTILADPSVSDEAENVIVWRRLDQPGHESARLSFQASSRHLAGTAVFAYDRLACRLDYLVVCDLEWRTTAARVTGWVGQATIEIEISADPARRWWLNGKEVPEVARCLDLDLNFSPSTNLLPIRRLDLSLGQAAEVRAAWLRFPGFNLEPLDQIYRHVANMAYRYESGGGAFVRKITVNAAGFVTDYPGFWLVEAGT